MLPWKITVTLYTTKATQCVNVMMNGVQYVEFALQVCLSVAFLFSDQSHTVKDEVFWLHRHQ